MARHPLTLARELTYPQQELLYDPQTSGGLLLALPEDQARKLLRQLHEAGIAEAAIIGRMVEGVVGVTVQ